MPRINFNKVEDIQEFPPLPKGKYLCRAAEVEETTSSKGDDMWKIRFEVTKGDYTGRYVFAYLAFNHRSLARLKQMCHAMGLETSQEVNLTTNSLIGRICFVRIVEQEYEDENGEVKIGNNVPYDAFSPVRNDLDGKTAEIKDDELDRPPF
jgi:hypothetical protein